MPVLKPADGSATAAIIWIQGADIAAEAYIPVAQAVQNATNGIWVAIPSFLENLADPLTMDKAIASAEKELIAAGMPAGTPILLAGHSLGGSVVEAHLAKNDVPSNIKGAILMGSFIQRSNLEELKSQSLLSLPILTLGGEMDGLCRQTRIAESAYHSPRIVPKVNWPVVLLEGVSHMQFASGTPPRVVRDNDLKPTVSYPLAHAAIAESIASFLDCLLGGDSDNKTKACATLQKQEQTTQAAFRNWWSAQALEGSWHLKPPCQTLLQTTAGAPSFHHSLQGTVNDPSACWIGSAWSELAQRHMANYTRIDDADEFHHVYDIPVHLPHIVEPCGSNSSCTVTTMTVTQLEYDVGDEKADTAFYPVSAFEFKTKMSSRQRCLHAIDIDIPFNETDAPSICMEINQQALDWALEQLTPAQKARYESLGEKMVVAPDLGPYNNGPEWIWDPLHYDKVVNSQTGEMEMVIRSPMMKTPLKYFVQAAAGFHYCKLLSPARALEWMLVDSLKAKDGIKSM